MATSSSNGGKGEDNSAQWTRIVRKGKKPGKKQRQPSHPPAAGPVENFQPNASPQLTVNDITTNHDKVASKWRETDCCANLSELIKKHAASHAPISRAICLGLGAFDPEDGSWVAQRRSHIQLAAFLTMVEILEASSGNKIECYYQEPRFAKPDKDFIKGLGGKVVDSPRSYDLIDQNTLIYGVHLYRDIWAAALAKSLPGLFVGTGWDIWDESLDAEKSADFERIREMDASFDKYAFPQDEQTSFSSTCIYWKRSDTDLCSLVKELVLEGPKEGGSVDMKEAAGAGEANENT